ncbi:MAG: hypothetical protein H0V18_11705 [Pyrinomonadaceae bacterium]|nr:hypothetical protein [Pyrinomonadaceae bacterium]
MRDRTRAGGPPASRVPGLSEAAPTTSAVPAKSWQARRDQGMRLDNDGVGREQAVPAVDELCEDLGRGVVMLVVHVDEC